MRGDLTVPVPNPETARKMRTAKGTKKVPKRCRARHSAIVAHTGPSRTSNKSVTGRTIPTGFVGDLFGKTPSWFL
jgi:hypothetical protein